MTFLLIILGFLGVFLVGLVVFIQVVAPMLRRRKNAASAATEGERPEETTEEMINRLVDQRKTRKQEKRLNYSYAEDDPFFFISGDEVWVGVVPESTQDSFRTASEQIAIVGHINDLYRGILRFMQQLGDKGFTEVRCHETVRFQPANVARWEQQYLKQAWNPSALFNDLLHTGVAPHIADSTPERRRMIMVRIGVINGKTTVDPLSALMNDGIADEHYEARELAFMRNRARQFYDRMAQHGALPMDRSDLSWLVRKTMSGHFQPDPEIGYSATRPWRAQWFDMWASATGRVLPDAVEILEPDPENGIPRRSYVTTLTVANVPESHMEFGESSAWGKVLRDLPYPVEVSWRFALMDEKAWQKFAKKRIGNLRDEAANRNQAANNPPDAQTGDLRFDRTWDAAEELHAQLQLEPAPVMIGQLRLVVAAPSLSALSDAVREVKNAVTTMTLERKRGVQLALLEEQLPGKVNVERIGKQFLSKHAGGIDIGERWSSIETLALPRLDSTPTVGDRAEFRGGVTKGWMGHPIGYSVENGAIVHFDPFVAIARDNAGGVAIIGASGSGKSSLSLMLFFWLSESGVQTVVADPKNDFEAFCHYVAFGDQVTDPRFEDEAQSMDIELGGPDSAFTVINRDFWEQTDLIDLWRGRAGMLDPFLLCDDVRRGASLAREIIQQLIADPKERKIIDRALQTMQSDYDRVTSEETDTGEPKPFAMGLRLVAGYIGQEIENLNTDFLGPEQVKKMGAAEQLAIRDRIKDLEAVADRLNRAAEEDFSKLLFGNGEDTGPATGNLRTLDKRRTVITLRGVDPPKKDNPEEWSPKERNAAAALFTALYRISDVMQSVRKVHKPNGPADAPPQRRPRALFVDEGYMITRIPAGRDLIQVALRQGRSFNFVVVFISQQASDIAALQSSSGEGDEVSTNQFPTIFAFWQDSDTEALAALRLLRGSMDDDDPTVVRDLARRLTKAEGILGTGRCVMKDVDGRVGPIQTDMLFRELWAAVETNPNFRPHVQNQRISAQGRDWETVSDTRDMLRTGVVRGVIAEHHTATSTVFEMDEWDHYLEDEPA
ncbi:ATP-binding protein [Dietzia sp. 179-F 9C3 NHS]|uniref:ATP-binding protein n=1 Tax=Dietzia sp. 179-F 9C3 NHS TaxID=3374295 RepID=UPI003879F2F7